MKKKISILVVIIIILIIFGCIANAEKETGSEDLIMQRQVMENFLEEDEGSSFGYILCSINNSQTK